MAADALSRATAALAGVALGDAMGMPSQTLTRNQIQAAYGRITDFTAPFPDHPVSHGLQAAMITDDTEQTLLLADLLLQGFSDQAWAEALLKWERGILARGLRDLLGPSSKRALTALLNGTPASETGLTGTTNGAAMRIAPVAIATPLAQLIPRVAATCRVTHNTAGAISAAAAVAAVISQGIEGASFDTAIPAALAAATKGATHGAPVGEADIAARIATALTAGDESGLAALGTSVASHHAIPAAFGVVRLAKGDPWQAALIAANIGDDTDTIGAIACAMAGACAGLSAFPPDKLAQVIKVNALDLGPLAARLLAQRTNA